MKQQPKQATARRIVNETVAADHCGLSVHTLRKDRLETQRIPFLRIGSAIRYDLDKVDAMLDSLVVGGNSTQRRLKISNVGAAA